MAIRTDGGGVGNSIAVNHLFRRSICHLYGRTLNNISINSDAAMKLLSIDRLCTALKLSNF